MHFPAIQRIVLSLLETAQAYNHVTATCNAMGPFSQIFLCSRPRGLLMELDGHPLPSMWGLNYAFVCVSVCPRLHARFEFFCLYK